MKLTALVRSPSAVRGRCSFRPCRAGNLPTKMSPCSQILLFFHAVEDFSRGGGSGGLELTVVVRLASDVRGRRSWLRPCRACSGRHQSRPCIQILLLHTETVSRLHTDDFTAERAAWTVSVWDLSCLAWLKL